MVYIYYCKFLPVQKDKAKKKKMLELKKNYYQEKANKIDNN